MGLALNRTSPYRVFMTLDTHDWFATALSALAEPQGQRVWSIIISFLGDMAQDEGAGISSAALTRVITPLGSSPKPFVLRCTACARTAGPRASVVAVARVIS